MSLLRNSVSDGQPLRIPASEYNAFLETARHFRDANIVATGLNQERDVPFGMVRVRNRTDVDLAKGDVVELDSLAIDPELYEDAFQQYVILQAKTPTAANGKILAIMQEPLYAETGELEDGGPVAIAAITGVVTAKVNVSQAEHRYADVSDGVTTNLVSSAAGPFLLLTSGATGLCWAIVQFLGNADKTAFRVAKLTTASTATAPTQTEADGYAASLTSVASNLNTCVSSLITVTDPGLTSIATSLTGVAANTDGMINNPGNVAETLAGLIDSLGTIQQTSETALEAHQASLDAGEGGTLTTDEISDHNAIVSACTAAASTVKTVAGGLADHIAGNGQAAIYALNDYGVMRPTGESVPTRCEFLNEGEGVGTDIFIGITKSVDDSKYRITTAACPVEES